VSGYDGGVRWIALVLLALGCEDPPVIHSIELTHVVTRIELDTLSSVGLLLDEEQNAAIKARFLEALERLTCRDDIPPVMVVSATGQLGRGFGEMRFVGTSRTSEGQDACVDGARLAQMPAGADVAGPLVIDGLALEGRAPIGNLAGEGYEFIPEWWTITARSTRSGVLLDDAALSDLDEGEASSLWYPSELAPIVLPDGRSLLDHLVAQGASPEVDVDGDGREEYLDLDGDMRADTCRQEGRDDISIDECLADPDFTDGYELRVRFLLESIVLERTP
jgi:hypothetical protein